MTPLVLCIGMEKERLTRLSFSAMGLGAKIKSVTREDCGQTLAALCGLEAMRKNPPAAFVPEEMMVMAFFTDALLDQWLAVLRNSGAPVRLKAVLTPVNRSWTCGRLYAELKSEAFLMEKKGGTGG